ncbi:MAG: preprotein translocase subunit YajC [Tissierellia bacterium]|nr:preprotein translocase subunit YajC [Tissierellia bacterium]
MGLGEQNLLTSILPLVVMVAFFYFALIRPQKKKDNEIKEMRANLKVGDHIVTIGGIHGKIIILKEDYVVIESSGLNTRIDVAKWGINSVVKGKGME